MLVCICEFTLTKPPKRNKIFPSGSCMYDFVRLRSCTAYIKKIVSEDRLQKVDLYKMKKTLCACS